MHKCLLEFCSNEKETYVITELINGSSTVIIGAKLGVSDRRVNQIRQAVEAKAAVKGVQAPSLLNERLPDPLVVKGTSTLYDAETGEAKITWVKTDVDKERQAEIIKEGIKGFLDDIKPIPRLPKQSKKTDSNLLNLYTMTDYHLGMLAWDEETGANWDLQIAEDMMVKAFAYLIDNTPQAEVGFFNEMGDFEHYDSHLAITPMNKHILDADGRPTKMIRTSIRVQRRVIEMMAKKYKKVIVLNAEGNHNIISSVWKREAFAELYRKNPRVEVITDVLPYYAYEWGKNMLGIHHGHLKKAAGLPDVFISNFREMYGRTELLHIHYGHQHHRELKETSTCIREMHPTLAAPDAYSARGGYNSQRGMQSITYHKEHFEIGRNMVRPAML